MNRQQQSEVRKATGSQAGFTLLEVLIVIICVAILSVLVALYRTQ